MRFEIDTNLLDYFNDQVTRLDGFRSRIKGHKSAKSSNYFNLTQLIDEETLLLIFFKDIEGKPLAYRIRYTDLLKRSLRRYQLRLRLISMNDIDKIQSYQSEKPKDYKKMSEAKAVELYLDFFEKSPKFKNVYKAIDDVVNRVKEDLEQNSEYQILKDLYFKDEKQRNKRNPRLILSFSELEVLGHRLADNKYITKEQVSFFPAKLTDPENVKGKIKWADKKNPQLIALMEIVSTSKKRDDNFTRLVFETLKIVDRRTKANGITEMERIVNSIYG